MKRNKYNIEELKRRVRYDPDTGKMYWKVTEAGHVTKDNEAFTAPNCGYKRGNFYGVPIYAHVAAWLLTYGEYPKGEIDHINRDRTDNRLSNLRDVTKSGNQHNTTIRCDNKTGIMGVKRRKDTGGYEAQITINGDRKYLGRFKNLDDAIAARAEAEKALL